MVWVWGFYSLCHVVCQSERVCTWKHQLGSRSARWRNPMCSAFPSELIRWFGFGGFHSLCHVVCKSERVGTWKQQQDSCTDSRCDPAHSPSPSEYFFSPSRSSLTDTLPGHCAI